MLDLILLYAICALTFTTSKWMLDFGEPIFCVGSRMLFAGIILLIYYFYKTSKIVIHKQDYGLFLKIIIFHIYLTYVLDFYALKDLTSIESSFIYNFSPFITAIFSYLFLNQKLDKNKIIGLAFGLLSFLPDLFQLATTLNNGALVPKLINLGAVFCAVYGWIVMGKLVKVRGYSAILVNGVGMFFGGILALITSFVFAPAGKPFIYQYSGFIYVTLINLIVSNLIYYNFYGYLLKLYTPTLISFAGLMCPVFASLLGYFFLGETVSISLFVSFLFVAIGLYFFQKK